MGNVPLLRTSLHKILMVELHRQSGPMADDYIAAAGDESDDDNFDWDDAELPPLPEAVENAAAAGKDHDDDDDMNKASEDGYWDSLPSKPQGAVKKDISTMMTNPKASIYTVESLIIVDLTMLDETVHCKFDRNSVSDATKASALKAKIARLS